MLTEVGIPWLLDLMNSKDEDQVNATQYVFQTLLNTLAGMNIKKGKKADNALLGGMGLCCSSFVGVWGLEILDCFPIPVDDCVDLWVLYYSFARFWYSSLVMRVSLLISENKKEIDSLMVVMMTTITKSTISGRCRDAIIELVLKNIEYDRLNWGDKLIRMGGMLGES